MQQHNTPLVSIIIPAYQVQEYIARCLESCINQSLHEIEILIVDDCGSDDSIEIAKSYAMSDSRIRILHNPRNLGTFGARLEGIKYAKGEYITFLDSDDYLEQTACEKAYNAACSTKNNIAESTMAALDSMPDIVFFGMRFGNRTYKRVSPPIITKNLRDSGILCEVFAHYATPPWHVCAKLYKASHIKRVREIIIAHMGEDSHITMSEDVLKSFYICAMAQSSVGIRDKLYVYCDSKSSITRKTDTHTRSKKIADKQRVIKELQELDRIPEVARNACFKRAQQQTINILRSTMELERRYDTYISERGGGIDV